VRSLLLTLFLALLFSACSDSKAVPADQTAGPGPSVPPEGGGDDGGGGGGTEPPPAPSVRFDDSAIDLMHPGGFPSDLVADAAGNLFTVDDAQIPASLVSYAKGSLGSAPTMKIAITASHLIDHDGTSPARAPIVFGNGLFGAFVGDLALAHDRWLLVTVSAGNSLSDDFSSPLRLANLVVIDTQTAQVVQTVNLAWPMQSAGKLSSGGDYATIPHSLPSMVAFVPAHDGTLSGQVFVAMSNGGGSSAGLQSFFAGTVQVWRADFGQSQPLSVETLGKGVTDVTRTYVSNRFNPVGLTAHTNPVGSSYVILTSAGASQFDQNWVAHPTTDAFLEFIDLDTAQWQDSWAVTLGAILPAPQALARGRDAQGMAFGLLTSQTYAAAYFVDLSGLETDPVDPARLRLLRTVELEPGGATSAGTGFLPGLALAPGGGSAILGSFTTGTLSVLLLPDDLESGEILKDPEPFTALGPARSSIGALVAPSGGAADVFFVVNGTFDSSFLPLRSSFLGTLTVEGGLP
jgi:hypothetical protein